MSCKSAKDTFSKASSTPSTTGNEETFIYLEFEDQDPRCPQNFSKLKKWAITLTICYFTALAGSYTSTYSIIIPSLKSDLGCTDFQAGLGLGLYALGYGIIPLVASSFSEEVGRRPVYIFASITFTLTQVMVALAPNMGIILAGRALGGVFGAMAFGLIGGSIADIWKPHDRGLPMSIFAATSIFTIGFGPVIGGVIEFSLGWRWVEWIHVVLSCVFIVLVLFLMNETRSSIILIQMARLQRKLTGNDVYRAKVEIDKESLGRLVKKSCTRPLYFLLTEPIVQSISVWCGFTWGVVYCLLESVTPIFQTAYGFNVQQTGYVYTTLSIGAIIGFCANMYQNKLYKKHVARKHQEAGLYMTCVAGLCLPIGMFMFAWTASPEIHWIAPMIGLTVFMSGTSVILQVAYLYLADCYNSYASSAQAGPSLFRNSMAFVFPLFTPQMFSTLTFKWALTLFAVLALLLAPTPFVLFFYGSKIRERSVASREILAAEEQQSHSCGMSEPSHLGMDKV